MSVQALSTRFARSASRNAAESTEHTRSRFVSELLYRIAQGLSFVLVGLVIYVVAMFSATGIMPVVMAAVGQMLGIDLTAVTASGMGVWLMCSFMVLLFITYGAIQIMKMSIRLRRSVMSRVDRRLRGGQ